MKLDSTIKDELLKQNGIDSDGMQDEERQRYQKLLKRENKKIQGMKYIVIMLWSLVILIIASGTIYLKFIQAGDAPAIERIFAALLQGMLFLAVISTALYYVRMIIIRQKQLSRELKTIENMLWHVIKKEKD